MEFSKQIITLVLLDLTVSDRYASRDRPHVEHLALEFVRTLHRQNMDVLCIFRTKTPQSEQIY